MTRGGRDRHRWGWLAGTATAAGLVAAYMAFEAQWVSCREADLPVPGLPPAWSGLKILHLSDVHAGVFRSNELSLKKVVAWAGPLSPDLVFLTGDVFGEPERSGPCLELLGRLRPKLGMFAVTGNHEYGIGKSLLARAHDTSGAWGGADITLLRDQCFPLTPRDGSKLTVCGADYVSGGFGLIEAASTDGGAGPGDFSVLLVHEPPSPDSPLSQFFQLAFAGHTHGGQLRVPSRVGLTPLNKEPGEFLSGVYMWGDGMIVVSRGVGTSFLPFRLLTRPEATLWRLV